MEKLVLFTPDRTLTEAVLLEFWVDFDPKYNAENNWSNPDIRPNKFDGTFEGWLDRIGNWGKLEFIHNDPENKRKGPITKDSFLRKISTTDLLKLYGKFRVELRAVNKVEFIRDYVGIDGQTYEEIFQVRVELKPELKKGLHWWDGIFR